MSRDEALTATLNAARALCAQVGPGAALPADLRPGFRQLVDAVAAVDAVGEDTAPLEADYVLPPAPVVGRIVGGRYEPVDRPGLCSVPDCWRYADLPTGTCHHHSPHAAKPHPWQTARLRAGECAVPEEDGDG